MQDREEKEESKIERMKNMGRGRWRDRKNVESKIERKIGVE